MLAELGTEQFSEWYVAYHELHLEGGWEQAGTVAAAVHNELAPLSWYFGLEHEPHDRDRYVPKTIFGNDDESPPGEHDLTLTDEEIDALIGEAQRAWG